VTVPDTPDSAKVVSVTLREAPFQAMRVGFGFNTTEFGQTELRYTRYNWLGGARRLDVRAAAGNLLATPLYGKSIFGSAAPLGVAGDVDHRFLTPTWEIGANLNEPFVLDARASLGLGINTHRRSIPGIVIDRGYGANGSFTWRFKNGIPASLTYQFEENRVEAGDLYFCINFGVCALNTISALRGTQRLSPLGLSALAERADDPLAPTRGYNARVDLEHASAITASDFRYNRAEAQFSRYLPRRRSVIALHIHAGWVQPLESTSDAIGIGPTEIGVLHPRKRFYAGGARSVRGFGENQLGPRVLTIDPVRLLTPSDTGTIAACTEETIINGTCDPNVALSNQFVPRPLGGNTLIEGSIEYRFQLTQSLKGAVFVDAGTVRGQRLNLPPGNRTGITPGFGVRYSSPIGPVRIDLGIRRGQTEDLPVVTQFMGADSTLHLVQLATPKHYNPREGQTGFLHGVTSRLQLHLAIGEAW
jgi:outer membrane protein assembly factor BamA